eukprot:980139-Rhodomonas_salina.2
MSGTEIGDNAARRSESTLVLGPGQLAICLRVCYAMSGEEASVEVRVNSALSLQIVIEAEVPAP